MKEETKKLKVGDIINLSFCRAQIDKINPDGSMYVVTEKVYNTRKGLTNYFRVGKRTMTVWVNEPQ